MHIFILTLLFNEIDKQYYNYKGGVKQTQTNEVSWLVYSHSNYIALTHNFVYKTTGVPFSSDSRSLLTDSRVVWIALKLVVAVSDLRASWWT